MFKGQGLGFRGFRFWTYEFCGRGYKVLHSRLGLIGFCSEFTSGFHAKQTKLFTADPDFGSLNL